MDPGERHHSACVKAAASLTGRPLTVWPAVTEAIHMLTYSPEGQSRLLSWFDDGRLGFIPLDERDIPRIRELMEKYRDLPMDFADAAIVAAAEREGLDTVFTLDRRDFSLYRPKHTRSFRLLPRP